MQAMRLVVVVALLFIGAAVCQFTQANLTSVTADGFDTVSVMLDDMSFISELSVQSFPFPNGPNYGLTFYVYGAGRIRTVYPSPDSTFTVGSTPNENFFLPFIDFHTIQDTDGSLWGFGPVGPLMFRDHNDEELLDGLEYKVAIFSTKSFPNNPFGVFVGHTEIGFEGIFTSVHVSAFDINNVVAFFPTNASDPQAIEFGVYRTHVNMAAIRTGNITSPPFVYDQSIDVVSIHNYAQLTPFNADFKPILVHMHNVSAANPTTTYLAVVDPFWNSVNVILGDVDPTVPITKSPVAPYIAGWNGRIVSAVSYKNFLLVGIAVAGNGTGRIDVLDLSSNTQLNYSSIAFPAVGGFSNPQALVIDYFGAVPTLYVGFNGGAAILRIDLSQIATQVFAITGMQQLPFYLHRTWVGASAPEHVYFATNEQHAKVYRVAKADFCPTACPMFGYCKAGVCACNEGFVMKSKECKLEELVREITKEKRNKGGEVALGIFFTLSFIAAVAGWYLVYKNRRSAYQAV